MHACRGSNRDALCRPSSSSGGAGGNVAGERAESACRAISADFFHRSAMKRARVFPGLAGISACAAAPEGLDAAQRRPVFAVVPAGAGGASHPAARRRRHHRARITRSILPWVRLAAAAGGRQPGTGQDVRSSPATARLFAELATRYFDANWSSSGRCRGGASLSPSAPSIICSSPVFDCRRPPRDACGRTPDAR